MTDREDEEPDAGSVDVDALDEPEPDLAADLGYAGANEDEPPDEEPD